MNKILLLGASGQVGLAIRNSALPEDWKLVCPPRAELDVTDHSSLRDAVQSVKPDIIINCAALTSVDKAEGDRNAALDVNFDATANLAAQCSSNDIPLVHVSTDYVFEGEVATPYRPFDAMNPKSVYGQSKFLGEEAIRQQFPWHVILRTSLVFSERGENILTKTFAAMEKGEEISAASDLVSCPTYAGDLADAIIQIAGQLLKGKSGGFGTFHYSGSPECSRYDFISAIAEAYSALSGNKPKIKSVKSSELYGNGIRPKYSSLDCSSTKSVYGIEQRLWRDSVSPALKKLKQK